MNIIQTIKRWLHALLAWCPWKHSSVIATSRTIKSRISEEQMWQSAVEASISQPSSISLFNSETIPESQSLLDDDLSQLGSLPMKLDQPFAVARASSDPTCENIPPEANEVQSSEQQLDFLRYLVQRGIVNEGFAEGQIPQQYQIKR